MFSCIHITVSCTIAVFSEYVNISKCSRGLVFDMRIVFDLLKTRIKSRTNLFRCFTIFFNNSTLVYKHRKLKANCITALISKECANFAHDLSLLFCHLPSFVVVCCWWWRWRCYCCCCCCRVGHLEGMWLGEENKNKKIIVN